MESQKSGRCEPCFRGVPPKHPVQIGNKILCGDCERVAFSIIAGPVYEGDQKVMYGYSNG